MFLYERGMIHIPAEHASGDFHASFSVRQAQLVRCRPFETVIDFGPVVQTETFILVLFRENADDRPCRRLVPCSGISHQFDASDIRRFQPAEISVISDKPSVYIDFRDAASPRILTPFRPSPIFPEFLTAGLHLSRPSPAGCPRLWFPSHCP